MPFDDTILQENAATVQQANGNDTGAQIDQIEFKALSEVKTLEAEEGRALDHKAKGADDESAGSILLQGGLDTLLPGAKIISTVGEFLSERGSDMAAQGFSAGPERGRTDGITSGNARTMEQDIRGANRAAGSYGGDIVSRINNATNSLFGRASTDSASENLTGGLGKKNAMHIPADASTAQGLNKSMESIFGKKNVHKLALDSVVAARAERSAALGKAQQMAPGMGLGSGPSFRASEILQEAEKYRDTVAGTATA